MKVFRSVILDPPIEKVWAAVRAFDGVAHWNPGVAAARLESGSPTGVGSVRHLDIVDGTVFRETLLAHSDIERFYSYDIIEGPLPCRNYVSTHRFVPITDGDKTLGIWEAEFDCAPEDEAELDTVVGDRIYVNAMRGLNDHMKNEHLKGAR